MGLGDMMGKASELLGEHGDKVDMAVDKLKDMIPGGEGEEAPPEPAPAPA